MSDTLHADVPLAANSELCDLSALTLLDLQRRKKVSAVDILNSHLSRIEAVNPQVNALVTIADESALRGRAAEIDAQWARGVWQGPLHGLPVSQKDLTATRGVRTTFGSKTFEHHVPQQSALIARRCDAAGALMIGKSNTPEFGAGSHTFNDVFGVTRNPWDLSKSAGGSSGGAAASVACGMNPLACGSDMGGSLRNPAAWNAVVGLRPSPGRVPRAPDLNGWATLGVDGPMARDVADTALLLSAISGPSGETATEISEPGSRFAQPLQRDFRGTRIAMSVQLAGLAVDPEIQRAVQAQAAVFESMGCQVVFADPDLGDAEDVFRMERAWMIGSLVDRLDADARAQLKPEIEAECRLHRSLSAADLGDMFVRKTALFERMRRFMDEHAYYVLPATQMLPFDADLRWPTEFMGTRYDSYIDWMRICWYLSSTESPVLALPCGFSASGLPIGLQIAGRFRDDWGLLQFGHAYEAVAAHGTMRPPLVAGRR
ncbi:Acylamidase [Paraburkholderia domus]|uniref:Acylamidase n=1 Tax=Paraburkholderia domus TaxID=2793075 RepID=A0A9N8N410_9BURK|nr:amidase family protein [Paraburkholderia domus]MBK5064489.1 amidase [Burkholderia sp. R-70199]MBK5090149.1 amidase [Burkholderia sp. R-69927]MBK5122501.1 amidase [Burkholderia sp. R-69980]MBK5168461.1 amidase [Burkholderia sp. R-70211]MBK5183723.1 amidase [Burkholderia sp. R-69749]MCI0149231.1 amidase [Paraburkholderia sediminicola]